FSTGLPLCPVVIDVHPERKKKTANTTHPAMKVASHFEVKRQRTAALQDAGALPCRPPGPRGLGVRLSSAAFIWNHPEWLAFYPHFSLFCGQPFVFEQPFVHLRIFVSLSPCIMTRFRINSKLCFSDSELFRELHHPLRFRERHNRV